MQTLRKHKYLLAAASLVMVVLVAIASMIFAADPALAASVGVNSSASKNKVFTITAQRYSFDPPVIIVHYGDQVTIHLFSLDVEHGFYLDGYNINVKYNSLSSQTITFVANKVGTFKYRCSVPCGPFHPFMRGKLIVESTPNFMPFAMVLGTVGVAGASVGTPAFVLWRKNHDDGSETDGNV